MKKIFFFVVFISIPLVACSTKFKRMDLRILSSECQKSKPNFVQAWAAVKRPADSATKSARVECEIPPKTIPIATGDTYQQTYLHRLATVTKRTKSAGFTSCAILGRNFIQVAPALYSPQLLIGKAKVDSASGACPSGCGLSEVWCNFTSVTEIFPVIKSTTDVAPDIDSKNPMGLRSIVNVGDNYELELFSLDSLEESLRIALEKDSNIVNVNSVSFSDFNHLSQLLWLHVSVDVKVAGIRHRCEVNKKFYLALSDHPKLAIVDAGSSVDCSSGATINFSQIVENMLNEKLDTNLFEPVLGDKKDWDTWGREDPDWKNFVDTSMLQGYYYQIDGRRYLAVARGWKLNLSGYPISGIGQEMSRLRSNAQALAALYRSNKLDVPYGPVDKNIASLNRQQSESLAESHAYRASCKQTFSYMSGCKHKQSEGCLQKCPLDLDVWNETDNALFGGLSCLAGNEQMCQMVKLSQANDGNFFRSPDLVGVKIINNAGEEESPLSGDQFIGLMAYFTATKDVVAFRKFIGTIAQRKVWFPSNNKKLDWGYKFCKDDPAKNECLMTGPEWFWANRVAEFLGAIDVIPPEELLPESRYGHSLKQLKFQAAINPIGFRVHLVASQVFLGKALSITDPNIDEAAEILYGRQPDNPFFQYLYYGATALTLHTSQKKCSFESTVNHTDWSWQRAEQEEAWKKDSMHWDCEFMYRLLAN